MTRTLAQVKSENQAYLVGHPLNPWIIPRIRYRVGIAGLSRCWRVAALGLLCFVASPGLGQADLPSDLKSGIRGDLQRLTSRRPDIRGRVLILVSAKSGRAAPGVANELGVAWSSMGLGPIMYSDAIASAMRRLNLNLTDLENYAEERDFRETILSATLADAFIIGSISSGNTDEVKVILRGCSIANPEWGDPEVTAIVLSDSVRQYLGLPVPAMLAISGPAGARVGIDGSPVSGGDQVPAAVRLPVGYHTVEVWKEGYYPVTKSVMLGDGEQLWIGVRARNSATAPAMAFLASAVVPGLGTLLYGSPKASEPAKKWTPAETVGYLGAATFYAGGIAWLLDSGRSDHDFLSPQSKERYRHARQLEMWIAVAGYATNLIGSVWVGADFAARNHSLEFYSSVPTTLNSDDTGLAGVCAPTCESERGLGALGLRYRLRF